MRALAIPPAVVAPAAAARLVVDLLPAVLPDVGDHQRPGSAERGVVEADTPRIAQPEAPDLRAEPRPATPLTNGLSAGTRNPPDRSSGTFTSMRSILPSNDDGFCARCCGSLPLPPSPSPM